MILVFQVERGDTRDIGRYPYMIIRDTDSRPYTTDFVLPFAEHLKMPDLVRIGDRQAFARIPVSVFGNQVPDQPYRFACRRATL